MHLAYDAKRLFANASGLGNYSRTLVSNVVGLYPHHELTLYSPRMDVRFAGWRAASTAQVRTRHYQGVGGSLWRTWGVTRELQRDQVDLYHGLSHELPRGLRRAGVAGVVSIHDLIYLTRPELFPFFDRQFYHWKVKHALREADHVIAITERTRRDILAHFPWVDPQRVSVVYQSCEAVFFEQSLCPVDVSSKYNLPERFILSVGSLTKRKNQEVLLRALAQLPTEQRLPLVLVGRGESYRQELERLAASLQLGDLLHFVTTLDDTVELMEVYRRATVFAYPSLYEGFGIPVIEALLCNTPVVASSDEAIQEAGGPGALYIDSGGVTGFAEAIQTVLTDEAGARQRTKAGQEYVRSTFAAPVVTHDLMMIYEQVLAKR